jgi:ABC-type multidrug transport system ATPase subunit
MSVIISVSNLSRDFGGQIKAVDGLSFNVTAGEVYGFLGQNGAGKSTTIRMLLTLITPTSGTISIFGQDLARHRNDILKRIGAVIERPDLYKYLTALENLRIFAAMSGVKHNQKTLMDQLAMVGLADRANSKVKTYSQGMKQRMGLATALVHDPELIILDEPTNGLDPQGIADIRHLILHLSRDRGKTLMVSSHLLTEIEMIADSMLIIDKGKKIVEGRVAALLNPEKVRVEIITGNKQETLAVIGASRWSGNLLNTTNGAIIVEMDNAMIPELNRLLVEQSVRVFSLRPKHSLEDFFLAITKN